MLTPEQLAEIPEYHIPAIWHDSHWDNCDATNPDAHCRRCETFWPCDAARLLEHIKAMEERYSVRETVIRRNVPPENIADEGIFLASPRPAELRKARQ